MTAPAMAGLPVVQVVSRVCSATVKLLEVAAVEEIVGETSEHGEAPMSMLALLEVAHPSGVLFMVTRDSNNVSFTTPHLVLQNA